MRKRSRRGFVQDLALAAGTLALAPMAACQAAPRPGTARNRKGLIQALEGVHNFMVTTFHSDFELDSEGLRRNVADHARGFHQNMTIVVAGGLGELYSLDIEEHRALVTAAVAGADGKMPVVAGVGGGYRNALTMARNAEKSGADAVLIFPPGSRWGLEEGTYRCCLDVAKSVDIGVLIYPRSEEYWPRLLKRLSRIENIIGFKDPSGDTQVGLALGDLVPEDFLWVAEGEGHAAKTLPVGGRAYTTAVATFVPQASHTFWKHGVAGEKEHMNRVLKDKDRTGGQAARGPARVWHQRHQGGPGIAGSGRRAGQAAGNPGGGEGQGRHRRYCPFPFRGEAGELARISHQGA